MNGHVLRHALPVAVASWVLLLPVLCLGGVFTHACADCADEACAHEEDCFADPCADVAVPPSGMTPLSIGSLAPVVGTATVVVGAADPPAGRRLPPSLPMPDRDLPVHAADLPLLI